MNAGNSNCGAAGSGRKNANHCALLNLMGVRNFVTGAKSLRKPGCGGALAIYDVTGSFTTMP